MSAFVDDIVIMGLCRHEKNEARAEKKAKEEAQNTIDASPSGAVFGQKGELYGYRISRNLSLTAIYGFPCYVVKFFFCGASLTHSPEQELLLHNLCEQLKSEMKDGYYNLRIPSHLVDLIRAVNSVFHDLIFCGGTVQEICSQPIQNLSVSKGCHTFIIDREYAAANRVRMSSIMRQSFIGFRGQYHISPVTSPRAAMIYEKWVDSYFDPFQENTLIAAEFDGIPAGIGAFNETGMAIDMELMSVDDRFRGKGIYKAMLSHLAKRAETMEKICVCGTQMDHMVSQCTWADLGFRPFYSIYNFHCDRKNNKG